MFERVELKKATNSQPQQEHIHILQAVNEALATLLQHQGEDVTEALEQALRGICKAIGCDGVYLFDYGRIEADKIVSHVQFGLRDTPAGWQQLEQETIEFPLETDVVQDRVAAMMEKGTTTVALTEEAPSALQQLLKRMDIGSYLSFRIVVDGNIWGGVSFVSRKNSIAWATGLRVFLLPFVSNLGNYLERKKNEQALKAQRDYLRQIINSSPNPIYAKNVRGEFTLVNQAMAEQHGKTPEEMMGKPIFDFNEDRAEMEKAWQEDLAVLREGKPWLDMQREVPTPNGEKRYIQISKVPIIKEESDEHEVFTTITDITSIKRTEDRLRAERNFSESITSTIPDWVLLVDLENRTLTYSNIQFPVLGYEADEVVSLFEILTARLHADDQQAVRDFINKLEGADGDEFIEKRFRLQHKDGHWLHFYERAKVFSRYPDGRLKEYLAVIQDVTESVKAEQQLAASRQRYRNFIEYSYDGIYYLKFDEPIPLDASPEEQTDMYYKYGYIDECNTAFANMYGIEDSSDLIGFRVYDAHRGIYFEQNWQGTLEFIKNNYRIVNSETREPGANGETLYLLNHAIGDIKDGKVIGVWGTQQDITERRKAERALQKSRDILQATLRAIPDLKFRISKDGTFLEYYEPLYEEDNVMPHEQETILIGKKLQEVLPPELAERAQKRILSVLQNKRMEIGEFSYKNENTANGELQFYESRTTPINDEEAIVVIRNMTEQRKAKLELEKNQDILKGIVNALPDLKFLIDKNGIFKNYYESENENEPPIVPPGEFLDKPMSEILPEHIADIGKQSIRAALRLKRIQIFEYSLAVEGQILHYEGRVSPINEEEVIMAVRNITESKRTKNELQQKLQELDEKNKELLRYIESNFQLENFAYIASHDLREPVRNMRTYAQMLQRNYGELLDERGQRHLNYIMDSALRMNALIEDLLEYSRISSEKIKYEEIELERLFNIISGDLNRLIQQEQAEVFIEKLPPTIYGSRTRIKQLIQNLLTNAIRFHRKGTPPVVSMQGIDHDDYWLFEVKDNGMGIPEEKQEEIFQLFKRLYKDESSPGSGIGLAICQRIVEHHQGKIWVESELGKGSAFYFTIKKQLNT